LAGLLLSVACFCREAIFINITEEGETDEKGIISGSSTGRLPHPALGRLGGRNHERRAVLEGAFPGIQSTSLIAFGIILLAAFIVSGYWIAFKRNKL